MHSIGHGVSGCGNDSLSSKPVIGRDKVDDSQPLGGVVVSKCGCKTCMHIQYRRKKKRSVSIPFHSVLLVMNGQKKWRPVLPVPFRPFRPFCLLILVPAHAQMNLEILRIYRRVCMRGHQYLASSLACPELNGWKRTERNGTAKKRAKREEKWNGMERTIKRHFFNAYCSCGKWLHE